MGYALLVADPVNAAAAAPMAAKIESGVASRNTRGAKVPVLRHRCALVPATGLEPVTP